MPDLTEVVVSMGRGCSWLRIVFIGGIYVNGVEPSGSVATELVARSVRQAFEA
jgi:hypothetical protein